MDPTLRALLTDTLLHAASTGRDAYGVQTFGTAVARPGRIQRRMLTLFTASGRTIVPETKIFLDGNAPIADSDRLTLPDGTMAPIQGVETHVDEFGAIDHYVIIL